MSNRLAYETSPYLLQHADNPVEWYPWGQEALQRAYAENKPILLSIGYSACHWCHVMAHECFEDAEVAAVMNAHFINIKVDREERPDIDQIYQTAHYLLTRRHGGWPLTLFLTPNQIPFYSGTYFPKYPRYNLPGFPVLLKQISDLFHSRRDEVDQQNISLLNALQSLQPATTVHNALDGTACNLALQQLQRTHDSINGGFGHAPKFPHPFDLEFLLRYGTQQEDRDALSIALFSLDKMARGGIRDQLGGGFCRYSVDERWAIPHFEKMLYDNGALLALYTDAWLISQKKEFEQAAHDTAQWVLREMQSPAGGYFSSLDADSEHQEGKFYIWTREEISKILSVAEYAVIESIYGLDSGPNFEGSDWHLVLTRTPLEVAQTLDKSPSDIESLLTQAKLKLLNIRKQRIHPARDEKILVSWNALMIRGMARAARAFAQPEWTRSAQQAVDYIRQYMWQNQRLFATAKATKVHLNAYLDDHAFLLEALLELMQTAFRSEDLRFAKELADTLLEWFQDKHHGGFFFTSHDHEKLIQRSKPGQDNATPSGNGSAAFALQRLGHLTGDIRYIKAAERTLKAFYHDFSQQPAGYASMLNALQENLIPPQIVILRGTTEDLPIWQQTLASHFWSRTMILALEGQHEALPDTLNKPVTAGTHAWVCRGTECLPPIEDLPTLIHTLRIGETENNT